MKYYTILFWFSDQNHPFSVTIYTQNIVQYTVPLGHEIAGSLQHPAIVQKLDRLTKIEIYPQDYVK